LIFAKTAIYVYRFAGIYYGESTFAEITKHRMQSNATNITRRNDRHRRRQLSWYFDTNR